MFQTALNTAIILLIAGLLYRSVFFIRENRAFRVKKSILTRINLKEFFLNTVFQTKLFRAGKLRWLAHFMVVSGFLYLLIIHALADVTSFYWFGYYQPTVDPYQFLRNLAGFFVLLGCTGFLYRRLILFKTLKQRKIEYEGLFSILLILIVIVSGFFLEAVKIISEPVFIEMVEEYSDIDIEEGADSDFENLKIYWEENYSVVFDEALVITKQKLEQGRALSETYCLDCHSLIKSAFISTRVAGALKKTGAFLNRYQAHNFFYYAHFLICLLMLVTLPFSRFFHILLIPIASGTKNLTKKTLDPDMGYINTATLYACTNCGYCTDVCSVYPNFIVTGNVDILPHSKIESYKQMLNQRKEPLRLQRLLSGNADCTGCHKCTDICPSGIDLQNLWGVLHEKLVLKGFQANYTFIESRSLKKWADLLPVDEKTLPLKQVTTQLIDKVSSFENCIQCTVCTNVCPVVEYDFEGNDMTPQQIMNLLRLGKKHLATGTRMVWNCLTCFSCQEYCPQGIRVADIMLELRNYGQLRADAVKLVNMPNNPAEKPADNLPDDLPGNLKIHLPGRGADK